MQASELREVSPVLRTARRNQTPIDTPTKAWPALDAESGFEVQRITAEESIKNGNRLVRYKLGNIVRVTQDAFGLHHPDCGFLLASTFVYEGTTLNLKQYIKPFVELKPDFVLSSPLHKPNCTVAKVIYAIHYAIPAIEIIDSRVKNWAIDLPDILADNGSTGSVILGGTPQKLTELTLRDTRGTWRFNDKEVMSGNTANILGNPLSATALLHMISSFNQAK